MEVNIVVEAKILGQKQSTAEEVTIVSSQTKEGTSQCLLLRELIQIIVENEIKKFLDRQKRMNLSQVLSIDEIFRGVKQGKVDPGEHDLHQSVDKEKAIATALQAFQDGQYFVFFEGNQKKDLDVPIIVKSGAKVEFIRLVALAGG